MRYLAACSSSGNAVNPAVSGSESSGGPVPNWSTTSLVRAVLAAVFSTRPTARSWRLSYFISGRVPTLSLLSRRGRQVCRVTTDRPNQGIRASKSPLWRCLDRSSSVAVSASRRLWSFSDIPMAAPAEPRVGARSAAISLIFIGLSHRKRPRTRRWGGPGSYLLFPVDVRHAR